MSMPPLPPPPGGWGQVWQPPSTEVEPTSSLEGRPAWRQGRPGWTLLHFGIGIGIWFGGLIGMGISLAVMGRTSSELDEVADANGGVFLLFLAGAVVGWTMFAYAGGSLARRWTVFSCIAGGTWLIMLAVLLNATG
jgi:hypothetical protein